VHTDRWAMNYPGERRDFYVQECKEISRIWDQRIGSRSGLLPGSTIDAIRTPGGWCGQVQLVPGAHSTSDVRDVDTQIGDIYDVPQGALVVDEGHAGTADTAFLWAYRRPSMADHHDRAPSSVFMQNWSGEKTPAGQLTRLERGELTSWTKKYLRTRQTMLDGRQVDVEDLIRRANRMRGAIVDALPRAGAAEVITILSEAGMTLEAMPQQLARSMGWTRSRSS
jgi:hypothetical protein